MADERTNLQRLEDLLKVLENPAKTPVEMAPEEMEIMESLRKMEEAKERFMEGKTKHIYVSGKISLWV